MPRRDRPEKRQVELDLKYGNAHVSMFVNRLMYDGKKSTALRVLYDSFDLIEQRAKKPAIEVFEQAIQNVTPQIEVETSACGWVHLSGADACGQPPSAFAGNALVVGSRSEPWWPFDGRKISQ